ncbi:hypothetical protein AB205_0209090 [Aquarana catesbeiana]|uniref:Uncharacterized protein n=1 Tax=Aquarana catesbeiana TaxID=8400 RepID=A0A2G9RRT8_AQUCT|nr:hypothetical protein AB205_0209090 [Aquarana catesbeiana]
MNNIPCDSMGRDRLSLWRHLEPMRPHLSQAFKSSRLNCLLYKPVTAYK